ncbi:MAG: hypothetical protein M8866_02415 [marine benthic group bacterium]|nr:hypothetical protein [Candidatus Benthicola marisminoris]
MQSEWTVIRIRGHRGLPALDGAEFLSCVTTVRGAIDPVRWHYRYVPGPEGQVRDGLRVELPQRSPQVKRIVAELEDRIPPPDTVFAEPMRKQLDLDDVQSDEDMELCLDLLWRYSEFLSDLRSRNPGLTASVIQELTPGALLTFVTCDRRHLEAALDGKGVVNRSSVAFGRVMSLVREADLYYKAPPDNRLDARAAARIHHLAACTFASRFYPYRRSG